MGMLWYMYVHEGSKTCVHLSEHCECGEGKGGGGGVQYSNVGSEKAG